MVSIIVFLTLTNIALGYGLAIYINQNFGSPIFTISTKRLKLQAKQAKIAQAVEVAANTVRSRPADSEESTLGPIASESKTSLKAEAVEAESPAEEIAASEPVDEENVLAGIEEFRSQLAKMNESPAPTIDEPQEELVGVAT